MLKKAWNSLCPFPSFPLSSYISSRTLANKRKPPKPNEKSLAKKAAKQILTYACSRCRQRFGFLSRVKNHYVKKHNDFLEKAKKKGNLFSCDRCGQHFNSKEEMNSHEWVRRGKNKDVFNQELIKRYRELKMKKEEEKKKKKK